MPVPWPAVTTLAPRFGPCRASEEDRGPDPTAVKPCTRGSPTPLTVNTTLGNVKTALAGTYHHVSPKHAQSYLTSFAYRFDRRFQLDSIVERLAWAAVHAAPQPYRVVVTDV